MLPTVITASPHLQSMAILVNNLNETRDIYTFIRDVRAAYKPLVCLAFFLIETHANLLSQFDHSMR